MSEIEISNSRVGAAVMHDWSRVLPSFLALVWASLDGKRGRERTSPIRMGRHRQGSNYQSHKKPMGRIDKDIHTNMLMLDGLGIVAGLGSMLWDIADFNRCTKARLEMEKSARTILPVIHAGTCLRDSVAAVVVDVKDPRQARKQRNDLGHGAVHNRRLCSVARRILVPWDTDAYTDAEVTDMMASRCCTMFELEQCDLVVAVAATQSSVPSKVSTGTVVLKKVTFSCPYACIFMQTQCGPARASHIFANFARTARLMVDRTSRYVQNVVLSTCRRGSRKDILGLVQRTAATGSRPCESCRWCLGYLFFPRDCARLLNLAQARLIA